MASPTVGHHGPHAQVHARSPIIRPDDARGVYGLRVGNVHSTIPELAPAPAAWPRLHIARQSARRPPRAPLFRSGPDRVEVRFRHGEEVNIDRSTSSVTFSTRTPMSDNAVVHPFLVLPAAVFARWAGHETFHAGCFVAHRQAWAVMGHKGFGKSSTMGWLANLGYEVLTDDLLIIDGTIVLPGPRCIDLRKDAAERLGAGVPLGVIGSRERFRLILEPVAPTSLAGWVFLSWGESIEIERLAPSAVLTRLFPYGALESDPGDPGAYLELASLPGWELRRPRQWKSLPDSISALLDAIARI